MDGRTVIPIERGVFAQAGKAALAALAVVGVGGCAGAQDIFGDPGAGYVGDARERVQSAEWSRAEMLTVVLSEYAFSPGTLTFRAGTPYRLRIENGGDSTHFFVSGLRLGRVFQGHRARQTRHAVRRDRAAHPQIHRPRPGRGEGLRVRPGADGRL